MKTIQQVITEWKCPKKHNKKNYVFQGETAYCEECKAHYDLGMKKWS